MILTYFFHQTLNRCFSYIMSTEKKQNRKIWPLKIYSNLNLLYGKPSLRQIPVL